MTPEGRLALAERALKRAEDDAERLRRTSTGGRKEAAGLEVLIAEAWMSLADYPTTRFPEEG